MRSAQATLPVPDTQVLPGKIAPYSNPTPRSQQESFERKCRIMGFFPDIREGDIDIVADDEDIDPLPEDDHLKDPSMRTVEFDEGIMANEWSPVPASDTQPKLPKRVEINYLERYPQHEGVLKQITTHPQFG